MRKSIKYLSVIGLVAAPLLVANPAFAATTLPAYTVSVVGTWAASWSSSLTNSGFIGENAPAAPVPANKSFTPIGTITVTIPPLPDGYAYDGSWSMSSPGLLTNAWCPDISPSWTIPATGGTLTESSKSAWGTMPPVLSTPSACVVEIDPPIVLNSGGYESAQQLPTFDIGLPVSISAPPSPKPTPAPKSPAPQTTPTAKKSTAPVTPSSPAPSSPVTSPTTIPTMSITGIPAHTTAHTRIPFVVHLEEYGKPVAGQSLIVSGWGSGATVLDATGTTNAQGEFADTLIAGNTAGTAKVSVVGDEAHAYQAVQVQLLKVPRSRKGRHGREPVTLGNHQGRKKRGARATTRPIAHHKNPVAQILPWGLLLLLVGAVALLLLLIQKRRRQREQDSAND